MGVFSADSFYDDTDIVNYEMLYATDPRFPVTTNGGGGNGTTDFVLEYFGLDGSSPFVYARNNADGTLVAGNARFGPSPRFGPGRTYDERRMFNNARRLMNAAYRSDPSKPCFPWIRGAETPASSQRTPPLISKDMADMTRLCASYPNCQNVIWWYTDVPATATPNHAAMLEAVELLYPEWVWNGTDWEAA